MHPGSSFAQTVTFTLPSDLNSYWYCIQFEFVIREEMVHIAKKVLNGGDDAEIDEQKNETVEFVGEVSIGTK
jgi:hypothetical protein